MKFLMQRLTHAILLLAAIGFVSFSLVQSAPGDYFDSLRLNPQISSQTVERLRVDYGLKQPFLHRYERWVESVFRGQMGYSLSYNSPVWPLIKVRARNTLILGVSGTALAWLIALPWGVWSAARKDSLGDQAGVFAASALATIPELLVGLGFLLLAMRTGWFPAGGMNSLDDSGAAFFASAKDFALHLILPVLGLAVVTVPTLVRHIRAAMIEALNAPFIVAARAHGIRESRLLFRHALPAAANPLISLAGFSMGTILSGSLIIEVILSWPGIGPLLLESILSRDEYVVLGAIMLSSVLLIGANLFTDILLYFADPRIRID